MNYRIVDANQFSVYSAPIVCQKDSSFETGSNTSASDGMSNKSGTSSLGSSVSLSASGSMTASGKIKRRKRRSKKSKKKYKVLPDGVSLIF